ncbi:MAG: sigma-54 interaction domain-containing protein [Kiritimatiellia bacterium]
MKTGSIQVRLYLLVPLIFAGFTALAAQLTYHLMRSGAVGDGRIWPLLATSGLLVATAFLCGLFILWLVFRPVETFLKETRALVPAPAPLPARARRAADFEAITPIAHALNWAAEALGRMEAQALFPDVIAPSPAMRAVLGLVKKIAPTDSTVLILGESGTGKELIARNVHSHSRRADKPFVAINCAGIPEGLLESELFGHEKGSFTGAYARKIGKLEAANGGTVFLDEIADMPLMTQAKILRALQEREIERVGGARPVPVDIRVLAATNKDLARMVKEGAFREDLFFRINVFSFRLPALRERSQDIPLMATHLLRQIKPEASFSPQALAALTAHRWPGNVRELINVIEAAAALAADVIGPEHLNAGIRLPPECLLPESAGPADGGRNLDERIAALEKAMILEALVRAGGVQVRAAALLGIKERSLWHRIAKHHIDVAAIRPEKAEPKPGPQKVEP